MSPRARPRRRTAVTILSMALICSVTWMIAEQDRALTDTVAPKKHEAGDASARAPEPISTPTPVPALTRNLFEFLGEGAPLRRPVPDPQPVPLPAPSPTPTAAVRLIGLARVGGTLKVILSIDGSVEILAVGETGAGYALVALDEDGPQVRLRRGDEEITLQPEQD